MNGNFITALNALCATHGISCQTSGDRLILTDTNEAERTFGVYAKRYGLEPSDYGAIVTIRGSRYKIVGISPNRPKNCFNIECVSTGKGYLGSRDLVHQIIAYRSTKPVTQQTSQAPTATPAPATQPADNAYADFGQF